MAKVDSESSTADAEGGEGDEGREPGQARNWGRQTTREYGPDDSEGLEGITPAMLRQGAFGPSPPESWPQPPKLSRVTRARRWLFGTRVVRANGVEVARVDGRSAALAESGRLYAVGDGISVDVEYEPGVLAKLLGG